MEHQKTVLLAGIDPVMIDFSSPDFAPQNLSAERVMSALLADSERLRDLGSEAIFRYGDKRQGDKRAASRRLIGDFKGSRCVKRMW
jgi:hypothetical protein